MRTPLSTRAPSGANLLATIDPDDAKDPERLLVHLVHGFRVLAERSASVWGTYRDAAAVDVDIASDWRGLMELRRAEIHRLFQAYCPSQPCARG